jgi:hypothetical protein
MKDDSPVAALMLKLKKKPDDGGDYDVDDGAAMAVGKRLRKAVEAKDDMGVYEAVCEVLGLKGLISHGGPDE